MLLLSKATPYFICKEYPVQILKKIYTEYLKI